MTKPRHSMDGFIPRRTSPTLGDSRHVQPANRFNTTRSSHRDAVSGMQPRREVGVELDRRELDASLMGIDVQAAEDEKGKKRVSGKPKSRRRKIIIWIIVVLLLVGLGIGGWVLYSAMHNGQQVFKGSILDIIRNQPLKEDANGRSNVLIVGTSEDDPGHDASYLTDSIMVLSLDQKNKNAYMFSLPRDLSVKYGQSCLSGNAGKLNVYYSCVKDGEGVEADRAALTKTAGFIGGVVGMDIQYGVNVNYTVMRELVAAVGGITVNIEGSGGAPGIMDSNFDWKCGKGDRKVSRAEQIRRCPPNGHFIEYPNGPANLDAEHALYLAQARGDIQPTYGLGRSNFDRELNQQKIVKAIREKALSAGVLTDFGKVTAMLDALGHNLRTTFEASEVRTLVSLAKDIKSEDIQSISLIDGDNPVMNGNGQPSAGEYQFSQIQAFLKKKITSNPVTREEAKVVVLNGTGTAGVAQAQADKLVAAGFIISAVDNAPAGTYGDVDVYQISEGKPATKEKLESTFHTTVKSGPPPVAAGTADFVVIIGKAPADTQ